MSTQDDLKKIWQQEKEQLKKDLNSREKIYQKNEVPIKFGVKKPHSTDLKKKKITPETDHFLRSQLGI